MSLDTEVDLGPGRTVLDGDPAAPPHNSTKGAQQPLFSFFGPCLFWPRSPISATAELLFCFPYNIRIIIRTIQAYVIHYYNLTFTFMSHAAIYSSV